MLSLFYFQDFFSLRFEGLKAEAWLAPGLCLFCSLRSQHATTHDDLLTTCWIHEDTHIARTAADYLNNFQDLFVIS